VVNGSLAPADHFRAAVQTKIGPDNDIRRLPAPVFIKYMTDWSCSGCSERPAAGRGPSYRGAMPEQAIEIAHPPQALLRAVNPALRRALKTPLGTVLKQFMVVTFTGRKTGRRLSVPVSAHHLDGELYVILEAKWKYNFRDGAPAEVTHSGKTAHMHGELINDPEAVADIVHRVAQKYGAKKTRQTTGMKFRGNSVPSKDEFQSAATRLGISAIRLTPAP
jgi:hypothetical protein